MGKPTAKEKAKAEKAAKVKAAREKENKKTLWYLAGRGNDNAKDALVVPFGK